MRCRDALGYGIEFSERLLYGRFWPLGRHMPGLEREPRTL